VLANTSIVVRPSTDIAATACNMHQAAINRWLLLLIDENLIVGHSFGFVQLIAWVCLFVMARNIAIVD